METATAVTLADDDVRRACTAMRSDIEMVLGGAHTWNGVRAASDAMDAFERSLVRRDRASWRTFYALLSAIVRGAGRPDGERMRAARAHLQAFLDENRDLEEA